MPCATGGAELARQMRALGGPGVLPEIWESRARGYRFGAPDERLLAAWRECGAAGLHVDLVYAPHALDTLLDRDVDDGRPTCYVHCGGVEGVATQLTRYRHAGLVDRAEVQ